MSRIGFGSTFKDGTSGLEIARAAARDARTHRDSLVDGGELAVYVEEAPSVYGAAAGLRARDGFFELVSPKTGTHRLALEHTDAARLAAHVEGFVEIALAAAGNPTSGVRLSFVF